MAKLTLEQKKLISEHVTGETKRCLAIINREMDTEFDHTEVHAMLERMAKEMIESSPFIKFHPKLLKRIPK